MKEKVAVSKRLSENIAQMEEFFHECDDIKKKELMLGRQMDVACYLTFIEVSVDMGTSALSEVLKYLKGLGKEEIYQALEQNALGISDATYFDTIEDAVDGLLTGEVILFVDGFDRAVKIPDDGYPNMGITEADSEKVIRGSNEGFCDSVKQNAALIRKRIRSPKVKVKQKKCGMRSNTNVYLVFMEDLVYPGLVREIGHRLEGFEIDGVLDSGVIEQLTEEKWYSPFPQFQTTERPDRAAMAVLEGRVVVLSDNSPVGLILPTDYNSFIKTSDDYYNRWHVATFARMIRYLAAFIAVGLPGLYIAITCYHREIIPDKLLYAIADARSQLSFPVVVEVLIMELLFELLREAGIRLPSQLGNTIGVVGGLIVGQSAVEAGIVSTIVVIVVALTAIASFAIPNEAFASVFRLLKFVTILASAVYGILGFLLSMLMLTFHLASLDSFGIPYLSPVVSCGYIGDDGQDFVLRSPIKKMVHRPAWSRPDERRRLVRKR